MSKQTPRFKIPYPSENQDNYYDTFQNGFTAIDQDVFADWEARNSILFGGATIEWRQVTPEGGTPEWNLTWSSRISVMSPSFGQQIFVGPGSIEVPVGQFLFAGIPRGVTAGPVELGGFEVGTQLPINTVSTALAYHDPATNNLVWITGLVLVPNSTTDNGVYPIIEVIDPTPGTGNATEIQSVPVCTDTPTDAQVLTFDNGEWCPADVPTPPPVAGANWTTHDYIVGKDDSAEYYPGNPDNTKRTIQDALTAAGAAADPATGVFKTVYVKAGTYTENLVIPAGVSLIGSAPGGDASPTAMVTRIVGCHILEPLYVESDSGTPFLPDQLYQTCIVDIHFWRAAGDPTTLRAIFDVPTHNFLGAGANQGKWARTSVQFSGCTSNLLSGGGETLEELQHIPFLVAEALHQYDTGADQLPGNETFIGINQCNIYGGRLGNYTAAGTQAELFAATIAVEDTELRIWNSSIRVDWGQAEGQYQEISNPAIVAGSGTLLEIDLATIGGAIIVNGFTNPASWTTSTTAGWNPAASAWITRSEIFGRFNDPNANPTDEDQSQTRAPFYIGGMPFLNLTNTVVYSEGWWNGPGGTHQLGASAASEKWAAIADAGQIYGSDYGLMTNAGSPPLFPPRPAIGWSDTHFAPPAWSETQSMTQGREPETRSGLTDNYGEAAPEGRTQPISCLVSGWPSGNQSNETNSCACFNFDPAYLADRDMGTPQAPRMGAVVSGRLSVEDLSITGSLNIPGSLIVGGAFTAGGAAALNGGASVSEGLIIYPTADGVPLKVLDTTNDGTGGAEFEGDVTVRNLDAVGYFGVTGGGTITAAKEISIGHGLVGGRFEIGIPGGAMSSGTVDMKATMNIEGQINQEGAGNNIVSDGNVITSSVTDLTSTDGSIQAVNGLVRSKYLEVTDNAELPTSTLFGDLTLTDSQNLGNGSAGDGTLSVGGNASVTGTLGVTGVTTVGELNVTTLNITELDVSDLDVNGPLEVTGTSTLTGQVTAQAGIDATGAITGASVTATGAVAGATLDSSGAATVGGALGVTGATTLTGAQVNGNLNVTGTATLADLDLTDIDLTGDLEVSGTSLLQGQVTAQGGIANTGLVTSDALSVGQGAGGGQTTLNATDINGATVVTSFATDIELKGPVKLGVSGGSQDVEVYDKLTVGGPIEAPSISNPATGSPLILGGEVLATGDVTLGDGTTDTLSVAGIATFDQLLTAQDLTAIDDISAGQGITAGGSLTVGGNANLNSAVIVGSTIAVGGKATINADMDVNGKLEVDGDFEVRGGHTIQLGGQAGSGTTNIVMGGTGNTVTADINSTDLTLGLNVLSTNAINGSLTVQAGSQNILLNGDTTVDDDLTVTDSLTVNGPFGLTVEGSTALKGSITNGVAGTALQFSDAVNITGDTVVGSGAATPTFTATGPTNLGSLTNQTHTITGTVNAPQNLNLADGNPANLVTIGDPATPTTQDSLVVNGKLTVTGIIDPPALVLDDLPESTTKPAPYEPDPIDFPGQTIDWPDPTIPDPNDPGQTIANPAYSPYPADPPMADASIGDHGQLYIGPCPSGLYMALRASGAAGGANMDDLPAKPYDLVYRDKNGDSHSLSWPFDGFIALAGTSMVPASSGAASGTGFTKGDLVVDNPDLGIGPGGAVADNLVEFTTQSSCTLNWQVQHQAPPRRYGGKLHWYDPDPDPAIPNASCYHMRFWSLLPGAVSTTMSTWDGQHATIYTGAYSAGWNEIAVDRTAVATAINAAKVAGGLVNVNHAFVLATNDTLQIGSSALTFMG